MVICSSGIHCFADFPDLFALTSKNTHIILSASHFSVLFLSFLSYLYRHPSFFIHGFFISPSVPSILLAARLHLFFLTSLSLLPVFQPWLFPPSFTVTLTLSCPVSLSRYVPSFPPLKVHPFVSRLRPIHINISFCLSTFRRCNLSHFAAPSISR